MFTDYFTDRSIPHRGNKGKDEGILKMKLTPFSANELIINPM